MSGSVINKSAPFVVTNLDPGMNDWMNLLMKNVMLNLNCHAIAVVKEVNYQNQTLSAEVVYKKVRLVRGNNAVYREETQAYPILIDCPFLKMSGGTAGLSMPIKPGDECLICFNDRCIDDWFTSGQQVNLSSNRLHSMSDAIALVGITSLQNKWSNYDEDRAVLFNGSAKVAVGDKIHVSNSDQNLAELLQTLITKVSELADLVSLIQVTGVQTGSGMSGVPNNAAAITAKGMEIAQVATDLQELLE